MVILSLAWAFITLANAPAIQIAAAQRMSSCVINVQKLISFVLLPC